MSTGVRKSSHRGNEAQHRPSFNFNKVARSFYMCMTGEYLQVQVLYNAKSIRQLSKIGRLKYGGRKEWRVGKQGAV